MYLQPHTRTHHAPPMQQKRRHCSPTCLGCACNPVDMPCHNLAVSHGPKLRVKHGVDDTRSSCSSRLQPLDHEAVAAMVRVVPHRTPWRHPQCQTIPSRHNPALPWLGSITPGYIPNCSITHTSQYHTPPCQVNRIHQASYKPLFPLH